MRRILHATFVAMREREGRGRRDDAGGVCRAVYAGFVAKGLLGWRPLVDHRGGWMMSGPTTSFPIPG
jgi:hypothetical protein